MQRQPNYNERGDTLEVKLRDCFSRYYYKGKADITNKKQMKTLIGDLNAKGVDIKPAWEGEDG